MRSGWIPKGEFEHILAALTYPNGLAVRTSLATGCRINDVLNLKPAQVKKGRFTIREEKTGKVKKISLPKELQSELLLISGQHYVFENRLNGKEHRTRQAVYKDLKRAAAAFRCKENITPHTARKIYAVAEYEKTGDLKKVQRLLNHSDEAVTIIYAMANVLRNRKKAGK